MRTTDQQPEAAPDKLSLHRSLEEVLRQSGIDETRLSVGLNSAEDGFELTAREQVLVTDGSQTVVWKVPSLRALFRGERRPPSMSGEPPLAYQPLFLFIETHVLRFSKEFGNKTDNEFAEVFSNLRRRPDGKSTSHLHFWLWQVAAGLLGTRELSAAEYEAIFDRLASSARTFRMGLVSRNYIAVLQQTSGI